MSEKLQQAQIQITPVDDGFVIQAQALDGVRRNAKQIATDITTLRDKVHKLVDQLYAPVATPTAEPTPEATPVGPSGTQSPS